MSFKGILLDIDNTLYDYEACHRPAVKAVIDGVSKRCNLNLEKIGDAYVEARKQIHRELSGTASSHNRLLYFQRMYEILHKNSMEFALESYEEYWEVFLKNLSLYPGVSTFLEDVKDRKICFVSDLTAHIQHRKIRLMGLSRYIAFLVTSEEAGREKPDPSIFQLALKKLGLDAHDVCMIGDNYAKDILGATSLGIRSFWLTRDAPTESLHKLVTRVESFEELKRHFHD